MNQLRPIALNLCFIGFSCLINATFWPNLHLSSGIGAKVQCPRVGGFKAWVDITHDDLVIISEVKYPIAKARGFAGP